MSMLATPLKGMRDYGALEIHRRNYIISTIRSIYERYGFEPLETPALESRATLTGKYGEEGEQLIFSVLKSGNFLQDIEQEERLPEYKKLKPLIADKGLRYDLTVPLIRYIAANQHQLTFPFRRYQIQPVWRADRPQKGRYREFLQCDIDIIGSASLLCEAEILKLIYDVLSSLQIQNFSIKINHRGILTAISGAESGSEKEKIFCTIVDKLEKIGFEKVAVALQEEGFSAQSIQLLASFIGHNHNNDQLLELLERCIKDSKVINDLSQIMAQVSRLGLPNRYCIIDPTLARGLHYYTGLVVEISVKDSRIGSLGGGGRYDQLGALFGVNHLSGIGFSFGIDRLYHIMESQQLFDHINAYTTEILVVNMQEEEALLTLLSNLRARGFKTELYPDRIKINKQLAYANKKNIPFVVIQGENELSDHSYGLKNMQTAIQNNYNWTTLCQELERCLGQRIAIV